MVAYWLLLIKPVSLDPSLREIFLTYVIILDEIAPLMIFGITEMWVVLIASSGAPLWPLVRMVAGGARPQYGPSSAYGSSRNGYLKSVDTNHDPVGLHSVHGIASRNQLSRTGSEDAMISHKGIMMTRNLTVESESGRRMS